LKPDNIQYIKGQGHSDVILLFEILVFLGTFTCKIWREWILRHNSSVICLKIVNIVHVKLWTLKTRTILTLVLTFVLDWIFILQRYLMSFTFTILIRENFLLMQLIRISVHLIFISWQFIFVYSKKGFLFTLPKYAMLRTMIATILFFDRL